MSDRKETPDLLGDILADRQDDRDDRLDNKPHDTATVHDASNRFSVSPRTIRKWATEFAGHLSAGANPAKGEVRAFSQNDMTVLATIAGLRTHNVSYKDIHTTLKATPIVGEGLKADELQPKVEGQPPGSSGERKGISQDLAWQYKERIEQLEEERDQLGEQVKALNKQLKALEGKLAEAQTARLEVEKRAMTAEELETSQRKEEESPSASDRVFTLEDQLKQLGDRDRWWQLWRRQ